MPKTDASINTHFQQYVLFILFDLMDVKVQEPGAIILLMFVC